MIVGTGIDIAEVPRIRQSIERFGQRFCSRSTLPGRCAIAVFSDQDEMLKRALTAICH
jgi:phosphopantetheinyl transferase (holo-ACP synthase)